MRNASKNATIRVWYVNHGYFAAPDFATLDEAVAYGKSKGFEFSVQAIENGEGRVLASWSVFGGLRVNS